ncbi:MAG: hydroxymethylbilane synthase [Actinomycetota bacterium]
MTSGSERTLRIGTRRSALALAQAQGVARALTRKGYVCSIVPMSTRGDSGESIPLSAGGVKGLFVDEIVRALSEGAIDIAVHSAKDLPAYDPEGVVVAAIPPRGPAHDVLVTREPSLGPGARVGTSSLRRRAQFMRSRPRHEIVEIRGNIDTRLRRLAEGGFDGLLLAQAGLTRLALTPDHVEILDASEMLPAPAQGFLAIQTRAAGRGFEAASSLNDPDARRCWETERHLVRVIGADCALPVGAFARADEGALHLDAAAFAEDGSEAIHARAEGSSPGKVAEDAAAMLLARGAGALLEPYARRAEAS